jgi:hypothetical protein
MVNIITTGNFPKNLKPGIRGFLEMGYKKNPEICPQLFEKLTAKYKYEEVVSASSFPLAQIKAEGGATSIASEKQGYTVKTNMFAVALGFGVTKEEKQYGQDKKVTMKRAMRLGDSFRETKEVLGHLIFNNAFTNTRSDGDGVAMISASHPSATGGVQGNLISSGNTDLSEAGIEQVITDILKTKDTNGKQIMIQPKKLLVHSSNWAEAHRIMKSQLRVGTSDNDANAVGSLYPLEIIKSPYLTDEDAWFIINDVSMGEGLVHYVANSLELDTDYDFSTKVEYTMGYESYAFNYHDWRVINGSAGA